MSSKDRDDRDDYQPKDAVKAAAKGALILGGAVPDYPWVHLVGIACLWVAAALTLFTGYDYLRIGLKHLD